MRHSPASAAAQQASASSPITFESSKAHTRAVFAWLKQIARDKNVPSSAFRVAFVIAQHFNKNSGEAYPSTETIGSQSALYPSSVRAMVDALAEHGHLAVVWGRKGRGHPNRYSMILKPQQAAVLSARKAPRRKPHPDDHKTAAGCHEPLKNNLDKTALRAVVSIDRVFPTAARVTEPLSPDTPPSPAFQTDHDATDRCQTSKPKCAPYGASIEVDQSETQTPDPLRAAFCLDAIARDGNGAAAANCVSNHTDQAPAIVPTPGQLSMREDNQPRQFQLSCQHDNQLKERDDGGTANFPASGSSAANVSPERQFQLLRHRNSQPEKELSSQPDNSPPRQSQESTMDEADKKARADRITSAITANRQKRRYLDMLAEIYLKPGSVDEALDALDEALVGVADHGRYLTCLCEAIIAYAQKVRGSGATNFMNLASFIRFMPWQPEHLPFNRLAA
jgi:hypothetical protein